MINCENENFNPGENIRIYEILNCLEQPFILVSTSKSDVFANISAIKLLENLDIEYQKNRLIEGWVSSALKSRAVQNRKQFYIHWISDPFIFSDHPFVIGVNFFETSDPNQVSCLIALPRAPSVNSAMETFLHDNMSLTRTEICIISSIYEGNSLDFYSRINKISVETTRWHLKNIQRKLGISQKSLLSAWMHMNFPYTS